jgi:hypothetical protein
LHWRSHKVASQRTGNQREKRTIKSNQGWKWHSVTELLELNYIEVDGTGEQTNLIEQQPTVLQDMATQWEAWCNATNDHLDVYAPSCAPLIVDEMRVPTYDDDGYLNDEHNDHGGLGGLLPMPSGEWME